MGLVAHIDLLGLHSQAAAQEGQCRALQRPQKALQQWGRAGAETCRGRGLESGRWSEPGRSQRTHVNPAAIAPLPRPLTAEEGRRAQHGRGRHCGSTGARTTVYRALAAARAVSKGQLWMEVASGGSEGREGKSGSF